MNEKVNDNHKISIRFYNDHEVRAVWNDNTGKLYFSVLNVIGAINEQEDYEKTRNYWEYLKTKLRNDGNEPVSITKQFKLVCSDGKKRTTDTLDAKGVFQLAKSIPNARATKFLDWFT